MLPTFAGAKQGGAWPYGLRVVLGRAYPGRCCAATTRPSCRTSRAPAVWRSSWKRTSGSPAPFSARSRKRRTLRGVSGVPSSEAKTSRGSSHASRSSRRSMSCLFRCSRSTATSASVSSMARTPRCSVGLLLLHPRVGVDKRAGGHRGCAPQGWRRGRQGRDTSIPPNGDGALPVPPGPPTQRRRPHDESGADCGVYLSLRQAGWVGIRTVTGLRPTTHRAAPSRPHPRRLFVPFSTPAGGLLRTPRALLHYHHKRATRRSQPP